MLHCPICRALLNGADTCRRCRAELKTVLDVERQGHELLGTAMHLLALGGTAEALPLLRRARLVHATPEARILWALASKSGPSRGEEVWQDAGGQAPRGDPAPEPLAPGEGFEEPEALAPDSAGK